MVKAIGYAGVYLILLVLIIFFSHAIIKSNKDKENCLLLHMDKDYIQIQNLTQVNGCEILKVDMFNNKCSLIRTFYLSKCKNSTVSWEESCGKSCTNMMTTTTK